MNDTPRTEQLLALFPSFNVQPMSYDNANGLLAVINHARALERSLAASEARERGLRSVLIDLRLRLQTAGRRPEECYEMSEIDAALAQSTGEKP